MLGHWNWNKVGIAHFVAGAIVAGLLGGCASEPKGPMTLSSGWQLQDAAKVPDAGPVVSQPNYAPSQWYKATVPGTVLTSLVNDGVYPEPLYGENNRPDKIPESLCRTSYWYRTQFKVPSDYKEKNIWLTFYGTNYIAEVWVNGHDMGSIKGAFSRGIFNVTPYVKAGETAGVAVQIMPPPHPGTPLEQTVVNGTGPNGGILSGDGATFLCTLGWDWIPGIRDRDLGIWEKVVLDSTGPVVVRDPYVTSDLKMPGMDSADLTVWATLRNTSDVPQSGVLNGQFDQVSFQLPVTLAANETKSIKLTPADVPQLRLANPRLWWPNGYGPQNLYALNLRFNMHGAASDSRSVNFGIRKITYDFPGSQNLTISVNGVPIMCKGGCWGMDEAMKRIGRDRLEAQVRFHAEANMNMIRNWVGQSTGDDFYDLCDQYGIMVWDEFFQPNRSDGPNVADVAMYLPNVQEKVVRYRSHPSIAIWCGRNESNPAPAAVAEGIQKIMAAEDPTRLYHPNSADGKGVRSGGPYSWRTPRAYYSGPSTTRALELFKTELGRVSVPTIESIHGMMPQKDWDIVNDDWAEHDMCRGAQEGRGRPPLLYPDMINQRYGTASNLPDFVRKAQMANYEAYRAMYEGRLANFFKPCTGVLTWMSNPSQPSFVWQIYTYDLDTAASFYAAKKACERVHVMMNENNFHLMVINNTPARIDGLETWARVFNMDGTLKAEKRTAVSAAATTATDVGPIQFPADLSAVHFIKLELHDASGRLVSDNFYWRAQQDHQDDFTALQTMPTASIEGKVSRHDKDTRIFVVDVTLTNPSQVIALMSHVQLRNQRTNERVLPAYYSDNYVTLMPGESKTISIEAASEQLGGDKPLVVVDGWNVTTGGGESFALNEEAQLTSEPANIFKQVPVPPAPPRRQVAPAPGPAAMNY